jgi:hypothetical protein
LVGEGGLAVNSVLLQVGVVVAKGLQLDKGSGDLLDEYP